MANYTFDTLFDFEKSKVIIPNEYQLVEYLGISNNSNNYINSNVLTQKGLRIIIGFKPSTISGPDSIFGNRSSGEDNSFGITYGWYPRAYYGQSFSGYPAFVTANNKYDLDYNNIDGKLYVNGLLNTTTPNAESYNYTNPIPIWIGRMGNWNNSTGAKEISYCHISVYDNWVLKLYPVYRKADNVAGMYDIVNDVFYTNQGTGAFSVGSDFPTQNYQNGDEIIITSTKTHYHYEDGDLVFWYQGTEPLVFNGITFEQTDYWQNPESVFRGFSFEYIDRKNGVSPLFFGQS